MTVPDFNAERFVHLSQKSLDKLSDWAFDNRGDESWADAYEAAANLVESTGFAPGDEVLSCHRALAFKIRDGVGREILRRLKDGRLLKGEPRPRPWWWSRVPPRYYETLPENFTRDQLVSAIKAVFGRVVVAGRDLKACRLRLSSQTWAKAAPLLNETVVFRGMPIEIDDSAGTEIEVVVGGQ